MTQDFHLRPRIILDQFGDIQKERELIPFSLNQLAILKNLMSFSGLKQDRRVVQFQDYKGVSIQINSCFDLDSIFISYPISGGTQQGSIPFSGGQQYVWITVDTCYNPDLEITGMTERDYVVDPANNNAFVDIYNDDGNRVEQPFNYWAIRNNLTKFLSGFSIGRVVLVPVSDTTIPLSVLNCMTFPTSDTGYYGNTMMEDIFGQFQSGNGWHIDFPNPINTNNLDFTQDGTQPGWFAYPVGNGDYSANYRKVTAIGSPTVLVLDSAFDVNLITDVTFGYDGQTYVAFYITPSMQLYYQSKLEWVVDVSGDLQITDYNNYENTTCSWGVLISSSSGGEGGMMRYCTCEQQTAPWTVTSSSEQITTYQWSVYDYWSQVSLTYYSGRYDLDIETLDYGWRRNWVRDTHGCLGGEYWDLYTDYAGWIPLSVGLVTGPIKNTFVSINSSSHYPAITSQYSEMITQQSEVENYYIAYFNKGNNPWWACPPDVNPDEPGLPCIQDNFAITTASFFTFSNTTNNNHQTYSIGTSPWGDVNPQIENSQIVTYVQTPGAEQIYYESGQTTTEYIPNPNLAPMFICKTTLFSNNIMFQIYSDMTNYFNDNVFISDTPGATMPFIQCAWVESGTDDVDPVSLGRTNDLENIVGACRISTAQIIARVVPAVGVPTNI